MLLHSIVFACRCARVQAEFEAAGSGESPCGQRPLVSRADVSASPIIDG